MFPLELHFFLFFPYSPVKNNLKLILHDILSKCCLSLAELLILDPASHDESGIGHWSLHYSESFYRRCFIDTLGDSSVHPILLNISAVLQHQSLQLEVVAFNLRIHETSVRMRCTHFEFPHLLLVAVNDRGFHKLKASFYVHIHDKPPMKHARDHEYPC